MNILFVICMLLPALLPVPSQASTNPTDGPAQVKRQPAGKQNVSAPTTVKNPIPSDGNQNEGKAPAPEREPGHVIVESLPKTEKDTWDRVYICLTGALVAIAGLTLVAIWYQAVKTREATDAIKKQTDAVESGITIQRTAMQQWVDIGNWNGDWELKNSFPKLSITFDLINPTSFPLTMTVISVTPGEPMNTSKEIPLNPRETYTHHFSFQLTEHHSARWDNGSIWLDFLVFVTFQDAFKDQQFKRFGKSCIFNLSVGEIVFEHYRKELPFIFGNEEDNSE
jgi:hypothetical protein